ncbi:hypothetical protein FQN50_005090 [Emmonsiellopsis sp. PD_5]|nr:hypothetical protein FQN50_005090 [Emmonsiellopsis sp. PD_5]
MATKTHQFTTTTHSPIHLSDPFRSYKPKSKSKPKPKQKSECPDTFTQSPSQSLLQYSYPSSSPLPPDMASDYPYAPPINDPPPPDKRRPNVFRRIRNRVCLAYYRYEVTYGVYVMTAEEKIVANSFVAICLALLVWGLCWVFPALVFEKVKRLLWLLTGMDGGHGAASAAGGVGKGGARLVESVVKVVSVVPPSVSSTCAEVSSEFSPAETALLRT